MSQYQRDRKYRKEKENKVLKKGDFVRKTRRVAEFCGIPDGLTRVLRNMRREDKR